MISMPDTNTGFEQTLTTSPTGQAPLKLAVQRSGRLTDSTLGLLHTIGLEFESYGQRLFSHCRNFPLSILYGRDDDIPGYIARDTVDLGIVGKQDIDGDTAQVGPEIAEILGLPQITYGIEVVVTSSGRHIRVKREVERGYEVIQAAFPVLVTVSKGEVVRRAPSFQDVLDARKKPVQIITAAELQIPEQELGLKGSFTQVVKVFPPMEKKSTRIVESPEAADAAHEIMAFLQERHFLP